MEIHGLLKLISTKKTEFILQAQKATKAKDMTRKTLSHFLNGTATKLFNSKPRMA